jgi:hypothetical protein
MQDLGCVSAMKRERGPDSAWESQELGVWMAVSVIGAGWSSLNRGVGAVNRKDWAACYGETQSRKRNTCVDLLKSVAGQTKDLQPIDREITHHFG